MKYFLLMLFCVFTTTTFAQQKKAIQKGEQTAAQTSPLRLYPNPADKYVNVYVTWQEPQSFTYAIYDKYDVLIKQWEVNATKTYQMSVNTVQMADGEYYVLLSSNGQTWKETLTIEK